MASRGAQTVERAIAVLGVFSYERPEMSATQVASEMELHLSTVRRLLATLEAGGLVERVPTTNRYRLGLKPIEWAGIALNQRDLVRHSLQDLDELRDSLNLNSQLAVLFEMDVFHLAYAVRSDTPRYYTVIGRRAVAHCTALGKVLLSELPRSVVHDDICRRSWRPCTTNSIQDWTRLDDELDRVAWEGYAIDVEERVVGTVCVGAPLRDFTGGVVAAVSVTGPADQLPVERRREIVERVKERAAAISRRLGHIE